MKTRVAASLTQTPPTERKSIGRVLLAVVCLITQFFFTKSLAALKRIFRLGMSITKAIIALSLATVLLGSLFVFANQRQTAYVITYTNGTYAHEDTRTTDILNYLTGKGPLPESERLTLYRQYVKNVLEDAKMPVPENIALLRRHELDRLAIAWYLEKTPSSTNKDRESLRKIINDLFEKAVRPPLEGFGPEVNSRIWRLMQSVGSPKVRWVELGDEAASRLVAYSAGEKQAFYDPVNNTIFIRYGDSVNVLLDEAPHAMQFDEAPYRSYLRFASATVSAILVAIKNESIRVYTTQYKDPASFEGEAHGPTKRALLERFGLVSVYKNVPEKPDPQHVCVVQNPLKE